MLRHEQTLEELEVFAKYAEKAGLWFVLSPFNEQDSLWYSPDEIRRRIWNERDGINPGIPKLGHPHEWSLCHPQSKLIEFDERIAQLKREREKFEEIIKYDS